MIHVITEQSWSASESLLTCPFSGHPLDKTQPYSEVRKEAGAGGNGRTGGDFWRFHLSDAADHALATIASILDQGETHREGEKPSSETSLVPPAEALISPDGEGYSKLGPGPIAALRFRWTARRAENGEYFVDETIGENPTPIVSGPMSKDAAIRLVDERESETRHRFEQLRHEITGRAAATDRAEGGEA